MKKFIFFLVAVFLSVSSFATDLPMDIAVLRGLDKVTGRISTFSIPVGEVGQFGKTFVVPESCYTRPPEESPENAAFLFVYEKSLKGENVELFKGWMFSSNPALSSMEHPVYDIWVLSCEKDPNAPQKEAVKPDLKTSNINQEEQKTDQKQEEVLPKTGEALPQPNDFSSDEHKNLLPSAVEMEDI